VVIKNASSMDPASDPMVVTGAWTFTAGITVGNVVDNPVSTFLGTGLISLGGGLTAVGNISAARFAPTGSSLPTNGMYLPSAGTVGISANNALKLSIANGSVSSQVVYTCAAAGSAASPAYALTSGNGMYLGGGGGVAISSGSSQRALFDSGLTTIIGSLSLSTLGTGFQVKEGANGRMGVATLVGGTVTVNNTSVTANSRIFLSRSTTGGVVGHLSYTIIAATSFTITASVGTDTSTINWLILEPAA